MKEILLLAVVVFFEMFHTSSVSRLYLEIRDDLFHKNKKFWKRSIFYRFFYTASLSWVGSLFMRPLVIFLIVMAVRAVWIGYRVFCYRRLWFRNRVTILFGLSMLLALLFSASISGAVLTGNPLLLLGTLPIFPMRRCLEQIDKDTHYQINRDKYDIDLKIAKSYVRRHDKTMEKCYGHIISKAAQHFGLHREIIKREIMMESMVRQSFSYLFFECIMKLLPKWFPYSETSTLGMAQASAQLAKKSLELETLPLKELFRPEIQIMAGAYLQAEAAKEYEQDPSIADSRLQHIVLRYTGTRAADKDLWNSCVFVEILREGEMKNQYAK